MQLIKILTFILVLISSQISADTNIVESVPEIGKILTWPAQKISNDVTDIFIKQQNIELTPVSIDYKGNRITFQYQMWKLKEKSVCANYPENTPEKSRCTIAAKEVFNIACAQLGQQKDKDVIATRTQRMYCNAASDFKPLIIQISAANKETETQKARKECNALIAAEIGSNDPFVTAKREKACNYYEALK